MADLRTMVAQGRKRIGFLIGAGAAVGLPSPSGTGPLIPAVAGLTDQIVEKLKGEYGPVLDAIQSRAPLGNVETILSRVRSLAGVIGEGKIEGLDGNGYAELGRWQAFAPNPHTSTWADRGGQAPSAPVGGPVH